MATREAITCTRSESALSPQQFTGNFVGQIVDTRGAQAVTFEVVAGAIAAADASNFFAVKVEYGNQADLSDAVDVPFDDLIIGDSIAESADDLPKVDNVAQAGTVVGRIGYRGFGRRYLRLVGEETGTANAFLAAVMVKHVLDEAP